MVARWLFLALCVSPADAQRAIHWVIRVSSLEETLRFTSEVLGMRVLRHEENDAACPLTCNGEFDTAWSKTMVGYGAEDENYALELTYNYGVEKYERGEGLQRFIIRIPHGGAAQALARAESLGYGSHDGVVTGPDGYRYELLGEDSSDGRPEPFEMIVLRASDPSALADWYASTLGMRVVAHDHEAVTMTFDAQKDILFMIERAATPPKITQWDGRNAFALPAEAIRSIYARVKAEAPSLIVHEMRELQEKLGSLFIVILRDPAGFEICLVSSETFDPSVRDATDYLGPDWRAREDALAAITQGITQAGSAGLRDEL